MSQPLVHVPDGGEPSGESFDIESAPTRRESETGSYGSVDIEQDVELPSDVYVSVSLAIVLTIVFIVITLTGCLIVHDSTQRTHFLFGVLSCYLLAFALAFVLGGGLTLLIMPEHFVSLLNFVRDRSPLGTPVLRGGEAFNS